MEYFLLTRLMFNGKACFFIRVPDGTFIPCIHEDRHIRYPGTLVVGGFSLSKIILSASRGQSS